MTNGRKMKAYLPVPFYSQEDQVMMRLKVDQMMEKGSGVEGLRAIRYRVELSLGLLSAAALKGLTSTTKHGKHYLYNFLQASFKADLQRPRIRNVWNGFFSLS